VKHSTIMAVLIDKRTDAAPEVQKVLTDYGCLFLPVLGCTKAAAVKKKE
jgi:hypothetical protein